MTDNYYLNYDRLFEQEGWKQFLQEMQQVYDSYSYDSCKDYETFLKVKSAREQLARVLNFEAAMSLAKEQEKATKDFYEDID